MIFYYDWWCCSRTAEQRRPAVTGEGRELGESSCRLLADASATAWGLARSLNWTTVGLCVYVVCRLWCDWEEHGVSSNMIRLLGDALNECTTLEQQEQDGRRTKASKTDDTIWLVSSRQESLSQRFHQFFIHQIKAIFLNFNKYNCDFYWME